MKVVGITGGIGSGKTTVCRIFEILGIPVFYADLEAKKLYEDEKIKTKTVKIFGKKILSEKGDIDKRKLAEIVFNDEPSLSKLNALIHPSVKKAFSVWIQNNKNAVYAIKEAAIMIESGSNKEIDYIISVISPKSVSIKRVINRDKLSESDIIRRIKAQISDKERAKSSDEIIYNDDGHSLIEQVLKIHDRISKKIIHFSF